MAGLAEHLAVGVTSVARCWSLKRADGQVQGFTDHDRDLTFEGVVFRANTGLTAHALEQTTGLAVDNSEALGALSDLSLSEADIEAGRYDGAEVRAWQVNWANVEERQLVFRGSLGEITRSGGAFRAELRGLAEALNQPQGRVFQKPCTAVLGDGECQFDLSLPGYAVEWDVTGVEEGRRFAFADAGGFVERWFERGAFRVLTGAAAGLVGVIRSDVTADGKRDIVLWEALRAPIALGDRVRLEPGCDKRAETCRAKFDNFLNYRGFPAIPGEDWQLAYPRRGGRNDGGSLSS